MSVPNSIPPSPAPRHVRPWTVWMLVALICVGGVVGVNILLKKVVPESYAQNQRLPYIGKLDKDLDALEASGRKLKLSELDGKVYIVAYVYTTCPRGCAGIVDTMRTFQQRFSNHPKFHLVSVTLDPEHDTPEQLTRFIEAQELDRSNWWFVTGDPEALRFYMTKVYQFKPVREIPAAERLSPEDRWDHELRITLIDANRHIRETYKLDEPDPGIQKLVMAKLEKDIADVLAEADKEEAERKK